MKKFKPLGITTKFFKYSLPLNLDTYRHCEFQCEYCFMKNRVIGKRIEHDIEPNVSWLQRRFEKVYDDKDINKENFLEMLLKNKITINCGTKSDPFQPCEQKYHNTRKVVELCNEYDLTLCFATKSDTFYDVDIDPSKHSFQLSVTNHFNDSYLEPNVPSFEKRVEFYKELKDLGFKVGIRFEPFIPNITDMEKCLSYFPEVDHVHISRLRLLPQIDNSKLLQYIKCSPHDFKNTGLQVLKGEIWYSYVKDMLDFLEGNGYSYSTSFINFGNSDCLGADALAWNYTTFDTFHLKSKYGDNWTVDDGLKEIGEYRNCVCNYLWTSNRQNGLKTVEEFYRNKWGNHNCKFNPKNQFKPQNHTLFDYA